MAIIKIETYTAEDMRTKTINAKNKLVAKVVEEMAREMEQMSELGYTKAEITFLGREENFSPEILKQAASEFRKLGYLAEIIKSRLLLVVNWDKKDYEETMAKYAAAGCVYR